MLFRSLATIRQLSAYRYGVFTVMVFDVPLAIGVAWGCILYSTRLFSDATSLPEWARPVLDGLLALNIDLAPTLLDLAGLPVPARHQGQSLRPLLASGSGGLRRDEFFCEHLWVTPSIPRWEGLRAERHVYARYFGVQPVYEFLHDLQADPDELRNLAARSEEHTSELQSH